MTDAEKREFILGCVTDFVTDFMCYDRRDDDPLQPGDIEDAILDGLVTVEELTDELRREVAGYVERRESAPR